MMKLETESLGRVRAFLASNKGPVALGDARRESRAAIDGGAVTVLEHLAVIHVGGRDAWSFLQGQLSCDLNALAAGRTRLGAWCTSRGRVRTLLRAGAHGDELYLEVDREMSEAMLTALRRYILRADVTLEAPAIPPVRLGFAGEAAAEFLAEHWAPLPRNPDDVTEPAAGISIRRLWGSSPRFELWSDEDGAQHNWSLATVRLTPVGTAAWQRLDIAAGLPTIHLSSSERFLPQMLNLDLLDGVSFTKGCYPGQEVVARTQHLGRVKRRLYVARVPSVTAEAAPRSGHGVVEADGDAAAGEVLDVAQDVDGGWLVSAVLNVAAANRELRLDIPDHPDLLLQPLPYGMPD